MLKNANIKKMQIFHKMKYDLRVNYLKLNFFDEFFFVNLIQIFRYKLKY